jgi:hypothetical protein
MDCTASCKLFSWLISAIFLFNIAYAFNCNYFSGSLRQDCLELKQANESLIPDLIYTSTLFPNHAMINNYNSNIPVQTTETYNRGNIRNAWLEIPYVYPSVVYNNVLYANTFQIRGAYGYESNIPSTYYDNNKRNGRICKIEYSLYNHFGNLNVYYNGNRVSGNFNTIYTISRSSNFEVRADFQVTIRERYYEWYRYCCYRVDGRCWYYCWDCYYEYDRYTTDDLTLSKTITVNPYSTPTYPSFTFLYEHLDTYWGNLTEYNGNLQLKIEDFYYSKNKYLYFARFIEPFNFIQMHVIDNNVTNNYGIYSYDDLLITPTKQNCNLEFQDFFKGYSRGCSENLQPMPVENIRKFEASNSWNLLLKIIVFIFVNVLLYKIIRKYWWFV